MSDPGVDPLLEVCLLVRVQLTSAACHDVTVTRDGISHVEIVNGICQDSIADLSVTTIGEGDSVERARFDVIVSDQVWSDFS